MGKSRKILIFSPSWKACIHYNKEMINFLDPYTEKLFLNSKNLSGVQKDYYPLYTGVSWLGKIIRSIQFIFKSRRILKTTKKENKNILIYSPSFHYWNLIIAFWCKMLGHDYITTVHDYKTHIGERSKFLEFIQNKTIALASSVIFLSRNEMNKALNDGIGKNKCFHLPHPLIPAAKNNLVHSPLARVLFLGRFKKYKGIHLLISCLPELNIKHLTLAGEGHLDTGYIDLPKLNVVNRYLSDSEIDNLLSEHEILILPYLDASQSGILTFGISAEVVMIISKQEGLKEQLSDASAMWVNPNKEEIIEAINKLSHDSHLFNKIRSSVSEEKKKLKLMFNRQFNQLLKSLNLI